MKPHACHAIVLQISAAMLLKNSSVGRQKNCVVVTGRSRPAASASRPLHWSERGMPEALAGGPPGAGVTFEGCHLPAAARTGRASTGSAMLGAPVDVRPPPVSAARVGHFTALRPSSTPSFRRREKEKTVSQEREMLDHQLQGGRPPEYDQPSQLNRCESRAAREAAVTGGSAPFGRGRSGAPGAFTPVGRSELLLRKRRPLPRPAVPPRGKTLGVDRMDAGDAPFSLLSDARWLRHRERIRRGSQWADGRRSRRRQ